MSLYQSVIVVGASAAGINCLRELRRGGFEGTITLVDKESHGAYERPPLSKKILLDANSSAADILLIEQTELDELNIECVFGDAVSELNLLQKCLTTASGKQLSADAIVLATGGEARRLPIAGCDLPNVLVLRHMDDALALRNLVADKNRVAVIGGGFIGAETVASLASTGVQVNWLDVAPLPLAHLLPQPLSEKIVDHLCQANVSLHANCHIENITQNDDASLSVNLADGSAIGVDAVVLGVGMAPNTAYLSAADAEILVNPMKGGITVNGQQATAMAGIFAAGDVAAVVHADGHVERHEHWQSAQHQGACAAAAILGVPMPDAPVDWFWSDQADLHIEMAGHMSGATEDLVVREEGDWPIYFSVQGDQLSGAVSVNNPNAVRVAMRMIKNNIKVDPAALADASIPLRNLMRG